MLRHLHTLTRPATIPKILAVTFVVVDILSAYASKRSKPAASEYVRTECAAHSAIYKTVVADILSQYKKGFSTADLLDMPSRYNGSRLQKEFQGALPLLYIMDGELLIDSSLSQPGCKRLKNIEYFGVPVLQQLSQLAGIAEVQEAPPASQRLAQFAVLPDLALRYDPFDEASPFSGVDAAPWFRYCSIRQQERTLLLPDTLRKASLHCPGDCQAGPFDAREPRAVFLGTPTGWEKGKRKAVLNAGLQHPYRVYAGLVGDPKRILSDEDAQRFRPKPILPLNEQVQRYKYIVNVEGNCAALRLKHLLAGPSLIFFVQSDEIEWFYPLLKPFVHYVPVRFGRAGIQGTFEVDLEEKVAWAEANPDRVETIVKEANAFAEHYLSEKGLQCFAMQLLVEYVRLLLDPWQVRKLKHRAHSIKQTVDRLDARTGKDDAI